jgi:hypothetical protein
MSTSLSTVFQLQNISNPSKINPNYTVVIFTEFIYNPVTSIPSTSPQLFNMRLGIVNKSNNLIYNGDPLTALQYNWDHNKNRLVIYMADINNLNNPITQLNIHNKIYKFRSTRTDVPTNFNYDTINAFQADGGLL